MKHHQANLQGTAIVTGASSGIGKVYAERLAARGYDLILVARRKERLEALAADLIVRFGIQVSVLVADLASQEGVATVAARIKDEPSLTLLVNNAGFSLLKPLSATPDDLLSGMINLNILALTQLSKAALIAFKERNKGAIINIGSAAGFSPYPDIPIYGATKAYVFLFSQALQNEVSGTEVRVQLVLPGAVVSEGWEVAGGAGLDSLPPSIVMSTEDCVDAALSGLDQGETITAPSLHDAALLDAYVAQSAYILQSSFSAVAAPRYPLTGPLVEAG